MKEPQNRNNHRKNHINHILKVIQLYCLIGRKYSIQVQGVLFTAIDKEVELRAKLMGLGTQHLEVRTANDNGGYLGAEG